MTGVFSAQRASNAEKCFHLMTPSCIPTVVDSDVIANLHIFFLLKHFINYHFCEARRASHCHSPQTTFSSNSTCCVLSAQKSAMHVVVYADRLTTQHSIVDIVHWSWSYWQFCYPRWHVECFWAALAAHWISSASHTSVCHNIHGGK